MQSMFRLPWSSELPGDKIMDKSTLHKSRPLPVVEIPSLLKQIKRKRSESPEPAAGPCTHAVKKWKGVNGQVQQAAAPAQDSPLPPRSTADDSELDLPEADGAPAQSVDARPKAHPLRRQDASDTKAAHAQESAARTEASTVNAPSPTAVADQTALQQALEAQINYEILLKHNELRLIEQELAKCQISLEQLRRCSLIPFPGVDGPSDSVSGGVGPALQPPPGFTEPQYAAPWGVAEGPYTRHYAKWLISDAKFDSMSERAFAQQAHGYFGAGEGRTTRHSFAEYGSVSKARTSRTSTGTLKLQALGENPAPAPKVDPLLHKRSTDGQWVRLYCAQCGHSNFSNTQGFLNHCRIKHNQVFKSHDQAACACGVPVDMNEVGNPVTAVEPTPTPATTPAITFPAPTAPGFVHPLIRANPPELAKDVHRDFCPPHDEAKSKAGTEASVTDSPSTPHLTALLAKRGFSGDLKGLVDKARTKIDLSAMETSDDDSVETALETRLNAKSDQLARLPVSAPNATLASKVPSARPGTLGCASSHARLPLTLPSSAHGTHHCHISDSPVELSPNTVESNPGLVSDHDDDYDEDDDTRSQPDFNMDDDIVVEDASDVEGVCERTGSRKGLGGCFQKAEGSRKH